MGTVLTQMRASSTNILKISEVQAGLGYENILQRINLVLCESLESGPLLYGTGAESEFPGISCLPVTAQSNLRDISSGKDIEAAVLNSLFGGS